MFKVVDRHVFRFNVLGVVSALLLGHAGLVDGLAIHESSLDKSSAHALLTTSRVLALSLWNSEF